MSALAPLLESFFTDGLIGQRAASPHTIAAYRDTFRLLLRFTHERLGTPPARLDLPQLDAPHIGAFLTHLETERGNTAATRNARLAAIHSFFNYAALRCPEHAGTIQRVLALPHKRTERALVSFLTTSELDALLAAPDQQRWIGRRDYTLLALLAQTGLRVSEIVALTITDIELGTGAHVRCLGKGRKNRITPPTAHTTAALRTWLRDGDPTPDRPLFHTSTGRPLSRDAVADIVARHTRNRCETDVCPRSRRGWMSGCWGDSDGGCPPAGRWQCARSRTRPRRPRSLARASPSRWYRISSDTRKRVVPTMTTPLLTRARQDAGLSKAELARRARTSRTTVSAYEHGSKTPTLTTLERLLGVAGFELVLQPRPTFAVTGEHRGAPVLVPDRLPALAPAEALAQIGLPLHLEWSNEDRPRDLAVRADRIRVYELVLREGTPDDVLRYVDPTLLLDVFDELNLPEAIRAAWQPAVARWRGR